MLRYKGSFNLSGNVERSRERRDVRVEKPVDASYIHTMRARSTCANEPSNNL